MGEAVRLPLMKRRRPKVSASEVRELVRAAGLRSTMPRVAVMQQLLEATTPLTHAEIVESLSEEGFDRATVYRNLTDLTEAGLLSRTDLGDHVWRFELRRDDARGGAAAHPHFVCTDCGTVECLPGGAVRITPTALMPRAIRGADVEVQLKGRCDSCV
jgi:Fur family ferric uptake transcriptional regulator